MSKKGAAPAPVKAVGNKINRKRRNSQMRKCLTKSSKRMFMGADRTWFKIMLEVEIQAKKKQALTLVGRD